MNNGVYKLLQSGHLNKNNFVDWMDFGVIMSGSKYYSYFLDAFQFSKPSKLSFQHISSKICWLYQGTRTYQNPFKLHAVLPLGDSWDMSCATCLSHWRTGGSTRTDGAVPQKTTVLRADWLRGHQWMWAGCFGTAVSWGSPPTLHT